MTVLQDLIVVSPAGPLPLDVEQAAAAATSEWPGAARVRRELSPALALSIDIDPVGEPGFTIDFHVDTKTVSVDGLPEQNAKVAAWLRSLMPTDAPRILAYDSAWSGHVDLVHGITPQQFLAAVVDHSRPGWNAGDPDLG